MNTQVNDPLVQCLIGLSRHHGTSTTVEALVSGLPLEAGMLTPRLFARASQRIGLTSNLVKQQPSAIVGALLPAVILSETGQACLLMSWHDGRTSARVIYPELLDTSVDVSREALEAFSNGTAIVCQPKFKFDERAPKKALAKDEHWFWSAVRRNLPVYRDVLIAAFFINLFALALPLFTMNVYDRVVPNHAVETLWTLAIGLVIVVIMDFTLRMMRSHFLDLASERVDIAVSAQIMERVLGSRLEHRPASVGTYAVNLRAFDSVRDFINSATITTLKAEEVLMYYAQDSFDIPMDFDAELESLAIRLSDDPEAKALIEGHADDSGARGYNNTLSLERAEAIKRRLVQQYAVNPDQIELIGFGEDRPREDAPEEQPKNRRAVILVE